MVIILALAIVLRFQIPLTDVVQADDVGMGEEGEESCLDGEVGDASFELFVAGWLCFDDVPSWPCISCCTSSLDGKGHKRWECMGRSQRVTMAIVLLVGDFVGNVVEIKDFEVLLGEHCII